MNDAFAFLAKLGGFVLDWFNPERVKQRMRVERDKIKDEKKLIESSQPTLESSKRLVAIEKRLKEIDRVLGNQ